MEHPAKLSKDEVDAVVGAGAEDWVYEFGDEMADAQLRKALWWLNNWMHDEGPEGLYKIAGMLQDSGIEPWPTTPQTPGQASLPS